MRRPTVWRAFGVQLLVLGLALVPSTLASAQESTPGGCGTPAQPATPADPGAPGGGATPATPATPADPEKCPEGSGTSVRGSGASRTSAQAGTDGVLGTADDIVPSSANTGLGGAAGADAQTGAALLLALAGLAVMASVALRRMTRATS